MRTTFLKELLVGSICLAIITHAFEVSQYVNAERITSRGIEAGTVRRESSKTLEIPFRSELNVAQVYMFNCSIGTPPQTIPMVLNFAFGDSQVSNSTVDWDADAGYFIRSELPDYIPASSSSYNDSTIFVTYDDPLGTGSDPSNLNHCNATYSSDNFNIAGVDLEAMPFLKFVSTACGGYSDGKCGTGHGDTYVFPNNYVDYWLGLGLPASEAAVWANKKGNAPTYSTFLQRLVNKGSISSNTYSVWQDPQEQSTGHLLLGGINSRRYEGSLSTLPTKIQSVNNGYAFLSLSQLTISLADIRITVNGKSKGVSSIIGNFDVNPGHAQYTFLSKAVATRVWDFVGASYNKTAKPYDCIPSVPCSYLTNSSTLDFEFEGFTINATMADLTTRNGTGPKLDSGPFADGCQFMVRAMTVDGPGTLSAGVLRQIYTVYDLQNNLISMAMTNFSSTEDNIIEIPVNGIAAIDAKSFTAENKPATKKKSVVGLAVGLGVGIPVFLIICVGLYWFMRNRTSFRKDPTGQELAATEVKPAYRGELSNASQVIELNSPAETRFGRSELG